MPRRVESSATDRRDSETAARPARVLFHGGAIGVTLGARQMLRLAEPERGAAPLVGVEIVGSRLLCAHKAKLLSARVEFPERVE